MIIKNGNDVLFSGKVNKAEKKVIKKDDKQSKLVKFSVISGKDIWVNAVAWGDLARDLEKGDIIFGSGISEIRTYNNKNYETVKVDFLSILPKVNKNNKDVDIVENNTLSHAEEIQDDTLPF